MKKTFAILLTFCYVFSANLCFAASDLYILQGINKTSVQPIIEQSYLSKKYSLTKKDPYLGRLESNPSKYSVD